MKIKILVCYHNIQPIMANEVLCPMLLGAVNAPDSTINALEAACKNKGATLLRDDVGEHISHLNAEFCELTALYAAWKNPHIVDNAEYIGLFHYRRILDFKGRRQKSRYDTNITRTQNAIKSFGLTQNRAESALENAEILTSKQIILPFGFEISTFLTQYEIYARDHYKDDLDIVIEIIRAKFPHYERALQKVFFTKGEVLSWCNMFVMRRDLFSEYCEFLFSVLFEAQKRIDTTYYSPRQRRIYGFLAERLTNVFIVHKDLTTHTRIKHVNMWVLKPRRPFFGFQIENGIKRFFLFNLRVWKGKA